MLHFNQTMILSAGNDRLLCNVFPASLKGPALAWFHKLSRGSITHSANCGQRSFPNTYDRSDRKEASVHCRPSSSGKMNLSGISPEGLGKPSNKLIFTAWMRSCRTSEEASGLLPLSFNLYPWILPQQWKNCIDGQISIPHWRIISGPLPRQ